MRNLVLWVLAFLILLLPVHGMNREARFEQSLRRVSFEKVDFRILQSELLRLNPSSEISERHLKQNLLHLFHNRLNRTQFLSAPHPQVVVEQVALIYRTSGEIAMLLRQGRHLITSSPARAETAVLIRDIGREARLLKRLFGGYFLDASDSAYSVNLPIGGDHVSQFVYFLISSQGVWNELEEKLDEFFLNRSPGTVRVEALTRTGISTLAEALNQLAATALEQIEGLD